MATPLTPENIGKIATEGGYVLEGVDLSPFETLSVYGTSLAMASVRLRSRGHAEESYRKKGYAIGVDFMTMQPIYWIPREGLYSVGKITLME